MKKQRRAGTRSLARKEVPGDLLARPQRFGILPTRWYWDAVMEGEASPFLIVATLVSLSLVAWGMNIVNRWLVPAGLPWLATIAIWMLEGSVGVTLVMGLSERAIRRAVARRREQRMLAGGPAAAGTDRPRAVHALQGTAEGSGGDDPATGCDEEDGDGIA